MSKKKKRTNTGKAAAAAPERSEKLLLWQQRLAESDTAWAPEVLKMDEREKLYNGDNSYKPMVKGDREDGETPHVRNIIFENIESMISTAIPQPKVTAMHYEDEPLAEIIENMIRNELDRQPFETINDMAERTVPIQGGVLFLPEWDNSKRSHTAVGENVTSVLHPKQLAPQPGVYTGIDDMDWFIVKFPTTKLTIQREYGVNLEFERESEPEIRTTNRTDLSDDALTKYIGYAKNDEGGIDKFVWVNDTELEDLENYQARRQPHCKQCGRIRPLPGQIIGSGKKFGNLLPDPARGFAGALIPEEVAAAHAMAQQLAGGQLDPMMEATALAQMGYVEGEEPDVTYDGGPCPYCGGEEWTNKQQDYERVITPIARNFGPEIPGQYFGQDEMGQPAMVPTLIPFYRPDIYPLVLQRSVSMFGQLLGSSDVDAIRDQQNTTNRIEKKIIDRLLKAGTRVSLPNDATLRVDPNDSEIWRLSSMADAKMIGVYSFSGDLQYELAYLAQIYEESRQILGITDSFQGRKDPTATSGKAKEYAAAMAAGRMESKRVMKNAAYAAIFERMFKNKLAYADEPRPVIYKDFKGVTVYKEFNRYDFLKQDADGQWYWNTDFLFSVDTAGPLAANREAMWQETRMNLQSGAFGDATKTETLILFWGKMEMLHYPGAGHTKKYLEDRLDQERKMAGSNQQMQMLMKMLQQNGVNLNPNGVTQAAPQGVAI